MAVERDRGDRFFIPPPPNPPGVRGLWDSGDEVLASVQGTRIVDALSVLKRQGNPLSFAKARWSASGLIEGIRLDGDPRLISAEALGVLVGLYLSSRAAQQETSHIYGVEGWPYPGSRFNEPPVITSVKQYETGSFGAVAMPDPGSVEAHDIRKLDFGQATGIGHIHPPGYGPAPSGALENQDLRVLRMYQDAVTSREWGHPLFARTCSFQSEFSHMMLSPEHLFAAPHPDDPGSMLVGLCHLTPEHKNILVYHNLRMKE